jgi:signal peptidase I
MSGKIEKAEKLAGPGAAEAPSREQLLVEAADRGVGPFYRVAGPWRLVSIIGLAIAAALLAQARLRHQDYLVGSLLVFFSLFVLSLVGSATPWGVRSRARSEARTLRRSARRLLKRHRSRLSADEVAEVEQAISGVEAVVKEPMAAPALAARERLDAVLDARLSFGRKSAAREYTESIGGAILVALLLRAFVFEPFHIPSGSMIPTLLVGDFIFVNKMSYGLMLPFGDPSRVHKLWEKAPERGDVVVFKVPQHPDVDYVKRVVGLPGDRVEVRDNTLWLNGVQQQRRETGDFTYTEHSEFTDIDMEVTAREYSEELAGRRHRTIVRKEGGYGRSGSWVVEPGRVFVMGDNRDNSADSRVEGGIGEIPFSYIKGRASIIWISFGGPRGIRFERMFQAVR